MQCIFCQFTSPTLYQQWILWNPFPDTKKAKLLLTREFNSILFGAVTDGAGNTITILFSAFLTLFCPSFPLFAVSLFGLLVFYGGMLTFISHFILCIFHRYIYFFVVFDLYYFFKKLSTPFSLLPVLLQCIYGLAWWYPLNPIGFLHYFSCFVLFVPLTGSFQMSLISLIFNSLSNLLLNTSSKFLNLVITTFSSSISVLHFLMFSISLLIFSFCSYIIFLSLCLFGGYFEFFVR